MAGTGHVLFTALAYLRTAAAVVPSACEGPVFAVAVVALSVFAALPISWSA